VLCQFVVLVIVAGNNTFCVSSRVNPRHSYTLVANDELDKRHWLQKLTSATKSVSEKQLETVAVSTQRHSKRVSRTDMRFRTSGCENGDTSLSSLSSSSSLMSTFSLNSVSTLASVSRFVTSQRTSLMRDAGVDSGIVT